MLKNLLKFLFGTSDERAARDAIETLDLGMQELRNLVLAQQASNVNVMADAAQKLIKSVENEHNAIVKIADLLIVKRTVDGISEIGIAQIPWEMAQELTNSPTIREDPFRLFDYLERNAEASSFQKRSGDIESADGEYFVWSPKSKARVYHSATCEQGKAIRDQLSGKKPPVGWTPHVCVRQNMESEVEQG